MAGLCEGGNEPPGSLKASNLACPDLYIAAPIIACGIGNMAHFVPVLNRLMTSCTHG
ncbi:hypothetical protein ANN_05560 [Periplaneta americana]|uniref:Uncharacterized protein n=1 Tax=Periplaneta americana TaxID=6978 RepID=A0ABQ8TD24_PERAM|nr:hypothetical protein ANN_05560 [Periplaneta americana]